mmetsp:Transcript_32448/g.103464  ORF Transcript_32448/g.103464 Transcript_32448/m.103464 type:complete len:219 (-) Transcript_32448:103-759(-)
MLEDAAGGWGRSARGGARAHAGALPAPRGASSAPVLGPVSAGRAERASAAPTAASLRRSGRPASRVPPRARCAMNARASERARATCPSPPIRAACTAPAAHGSKSQRGVEKIREDSRSRARLQSLMNRLQAILPPPPLPTNPRPARHADPPALLLDPGNRHPAAQAAVRCAHARRPGASSGDSAVPSETRLLKSASSRFAASASAIRDARTFPKGCLN